MKLMKNKWLNLIIFAGLSQLLGCSSVAHSSYAQKAGLFPNRDALYMQGKSEPSLQIPSGVAPIPNDPYFVIPSTPGNQASAPVSLIPPGLATNSSTK